MREVEVSEEENGEEKHCERFQFLQEKKIRKSWVFFFTFTAMFPPLWFLEPDVSSSLFLATEP